MPEHGHCTFTASVLNRDFAKIFVGVWSEKIRLPSEPLLAEDFASSAPGLLAAFLVEGGTNGMYSTKYLSSCQGLGIRHVNFRFGYFEGNQHL